MASTQASAARRIASTIVGMSSGDLSADANAMIERCFLDTVGVTLAGARADGGVAARAMVRHSGCGPAHVYGHEETLSVPDAAFVNATAGHALDYDDACGALSNHPSVTMVAPILALGESIDASGRDLVAAYAAGFEAQFRIGTAVYPAHYEAGWHSTATLGTFGAAAACANLLSLSRSETANALAIAASFASGLKVNFGTTTKPLHAGQAARSGTTAALVAAEGATGNPQGIDGQNGFAELFADGWSPSNDPDDALAIHRYHVQPKRFCCCNFTHTAVAAALECRRDRSIDPTTIDTVYVSASPGAVETLVDEPPTTPLQAKFSMEYTVACALARGEVTLESFTADALEDDAVDAIRERVSVSADSNREYGSLAADIAVETTDGESVVRTVEQPPGAARNPLSEAELRRKFHRCATRAVTTDDARRLVDRLGELHRRDDGVASIIGELASA